MSDRYVSALVCPFQTWIYFEFNISAMKSIIRIDVSCYESALENCKTQPVSIYF